MHPGTGNEWKKDCKEETNMPIHRKHLRITCIILSILLIFSVMSCYARSDTVKKGSVLSQEKAKQLNPFNRLNKTNDFGTDKGGETFSVRFSTDRTVSYRIKGRMAADLSVIFFLSTGVRFFFGACRSIAISNLSMGTLQVLRYIHKSDGEK